MKNFLKNKVTIASILILVISSVLYHNKSFYNFFYTKINPSISELVGTTFPRCEVIEKTLVPLDRGGSPCSTWLDHDDIIDKEQHQLTGHGDVVDKLSLASNSRLPYDFLFGIVGGSCGKGCRATCARPACGQRNRLHR